MKESDKIDLISYIEELEQEYPFISKEESTVFIKELYRFLRELYF